jgi:hypothetical protein
MADLPFEFLRSLAYSQAVKVESEDHLLKLILGWNSANNISVDSILSGVHWKFISQEYILKLYQNQERNSQVLNNKINIELKQRGVLNEGFENILNGKEREIEKLKNELEKFKIGEKLANSILDSPYSYGSSAHRRKMLPNVVGGDDATSNCSSNSKR